MTLPVSERILQPDDIDELTRIEESCFFGERWSKEQLSQQLQLSDSPHMQRLNYGLEHQDELIGFALWSCLLDEAELYQIAVLPTHRGQGFAARLLASSCLELTRLGIHRVMLEVKASNKHAIHLYTAAGFIEDGRRKGYYRSEDGVEDAILFSMPLGES